MELLKTLFRAQEDGFTFQAYSSLHILLILVMFLGAYFLYKKRDLIKSHPSLTNSIRWSLVGLILFQQVTFIYFSFFVRTDGLSSGLPLYTCRVAVLTALIALVTNIGAMKAMTVYWGMIGGILPMIYPDLMAYSWPHITNFSYFLTHFSIFWASFYFITIDDYQFNRHDLTFTLGFANLFLITALFANEYFDANYAYLSRSPILADSLATMPRVLYYLMIFVIYNLSILIVHWIFMKKETIALKIHQLKAKKAA